MANDVKKKQPFKFLFDQWQKSLMHALRYMDGRDIYFAKSEQSYHLTSTDAEAVAIRLLLTLERKRHLPVILYCMYI